MSKLYGRKGDHVVFFMGLSSFPLRYVSSSPCSACAEKIAEVLKARKNVKLTIFSARLFEWEEPEIQAGLKALHSAGCKLRIMKPLDFSYTWDTFVENDEQAFNLWEDCKDNYEYYHEKLSDILQWPQWVCHIQSRVQLDVLELSSDWSKVPNPDQQGHWNDFFLMSHHCRQQSEQESYYFYIWCKYSLTLSPFTFDTEIWSDFFCQAVAEITSPWECDWQVI